MLKNLNLPNLEDLSEFSKDPKTWIKENPVKFAETLEIPYDIAIPPLGIARLAGYDVVGRIGHAIDPDAK